MIIKRRLLTDKMMVTIKHQCNMRS